MLGARDIEGSTIPGFLNFNPLNLNSDTVLLAFNGWYDYGFAKGTNDEKPADNVVAECKNKYWIDQFIHRSDTDPKISQNQAVHLAGLLNHLSKQNKRVIIATHFVPRQEFIRYPKPLTKRMVTWRTLAGVLGSKEIGAVISKYNNVVTDVVFGHIHVRDGVRALSNINWHCRPIGYRYEWKYTKNWLLAHDEPQKFHFAKHPEIQRNFEQDMRHNWPKVLSKAITLLDY